MLTFVRGVRGRVLAHGLALSCHQCWPGPTRSGHIRATWPGAIAPRRQQRPSRACAASKSCRCHTQGIGAVLPRECLFAALTKCRLGHASLLTESVHAPVWAERTKAGIMGCSCCHSYLLTSRRAMRAASITALRGPLMK